MISFLVLAAAASTAAATPPTTATISPPVKSVSVPASGYGAPPTKQELAGDPNQTVCKRIATTGTRFASQDCRTRAEWNQLAVDSRQATTDIRDRQGGLTAK
jgi:hypothetical protein